MTCQHNQTCSNIRFCQSCNRQVGVYLQMIVLPRLCLSGFVYLCWPGGIDVNDPVHDKTSLLQLRMVTIFSTNNSSIVFPNSSGPTTISVITRRSCLGGGRVAEVDCARTEVEKFFFWKIEPRSFFRCKFTFWWGVLDFDSIISFQAHKWLPSVLQHDKVFFAKRYFQQINLRYFQPGLERSQPWETTRVAEILSHNHHSYNCLQVKIC